MKKVKSVQQPHTNRAKSHPAHQLSVAQNAGSLARVKQLQKAVKVARPNQCC